jgi:hypothetical protein
MRSRSRGDSRILRLLTGPHQRRPPAPLPGPAGATPIEARRGRRFSFAGRAGARPAKSVAPAAEEDQEHTLGVLVFDGCGSPAEPNRAPAHARISSGAAARAAPPGCLLPWRRGSSAYVGPSVVIGSIGSSGGGSRIRGPGHGGARGGGFATPRLDCYCAGSPSSGSARFSRTALVATMSELADIRSADHSGRSSIPAEGNRTPAAIGIAARL